MGMGFSSMLSAPHPGFPSFFIVLSAAGFPAEWLA